MRTTVNIDDDPRQLFPIDPVDATGEPLMPVDLHDNSAVLDAMDLMAGAS